MAWSNPGANFLEVYKTGWGVGPGTGVNQEDFLDLITNFDAWDNLLFAMAPKRQAHSTTHEWAYDGLPTASRAGVPEGSDFDAQVLATPVRTNNFTQIFRFDVGVTGTQQAMNPVGIKNVYAYQMLNGTHAIAKAVEQRIFDVTGAPGFPGAGTVGAGGVPGTPRLMKPLANAGFVDATHIIDAARALLTPDMVDSAMEVAYGNGLTPEFLFVSQGVKVDFSRNCATATGAGNRNIASADKKTIRSISVYEGDFGALSVIPNRSMPQATLGVVDGTQDFGYAWLIQRDKIGIAVLRPIKHVPLAKTGDNTKGMIVGELTLELLSPKGAAAVRRVQT